MERLRHRLASVATLINDFDAAGAGQEPQSRALD